jgi:KaiC/GvpD/RAD55 family RecA-like ATPase
MDPVLDYIQEKEWEYRLEGDEAIVKRCVFCGRETWKLYINRKSRLFQCFRASCGAKGHISRLKKHIGDVVELEGFEPVESPEVDFEVLVDECHMSLLENESMLRYLDDQGITLEAVNRFKLGVRKANKNLWLLYPSMLDGIPRYVKYRLLPFEKQLTEAEKESGLTKFKREPGVPSILFNQDALANCDTVIVTEGERDAISLLMLGYDNVVGTTGGAQTLKTEWYDALYEKEEILLAFDSDEAGEKGVDTWASRLGYGRCKKVVLPKTAKDITEYFMDGHTADDFDALLMNAEEFDISGVRNIMSILRTMADNPEDVPSIPTPWDNVNALIDGGFRGGELITLSAPPGVGKTTLSLQISALIAHKMKKPVLFFCQEMTYEALTRLFVCHALDKTWQSFRREEAELMSMQFENTPIYFGYSPRITPEQVMHTFLEARARFGIEFFVFDNLHTLIREHDKVTERIGAASKMFKDLAMEMRVPILLVAQPRKMEKDEVMFYYEIKGSSDIPADSDLVFLLHRGRMPTDDETGKRAATFMPETRFIVDKSRESAGGECRLLFDMGYRQFYSEGG